MYVCMYIFTISFIFVLFHGAHSENGFKWQKLPYLLSFYNLFKFILENNKNNNNNKNNKPTRAAIERDQIV